MARLLQDLIEEARRKNILQQAQRESLKWFSLQARQLNVTPNKFLTEYDASQFRNRSQIGIGKLYTYFYDPKHKDTLPYYDRMPMVFIFDMQKDRFLGLNLHYLPYRPRVKLMDTLLDTMNNARIDNNKKLQISYQVIKGFSNFNLAKPAIKMYLKGHLRSRLLAIPPEEWSSAVFLPLAQWEKASQGKVFKDSQRIIGGR